MRVRLWAGILAMVVLTFGSLLAGESAGNTVTLPVAGAGSTPAEGSEEGQKTRTQVLKDMADRMNGFTERIQKSLMDERKAEQEMRDSWEPISTYHYLLEKKDEEGAKLIRKMRELEAELEQVKEEVRKKVESLPEYREQTRKSDDAREKLLKMREERKSLMLEKNKLSTEYFSMKGTALPPVTRSRTITKEQDKK